MTPPSEPGFIPGRSEGPPQLAWHHAAPAEVADYWKTDLEKGLAPEEAAARLERVGPNKLPEPPPESIWAKLWGQVSDFTVLALLGAAAIAAGLGLFAPEAGAGFMERFGDSLAILAIVIINAVLGLLQAARAEKALAALRQMAAPTARVVRGGKSIDVPSSELVPGDILILEDGDRIAADARLFEARELDLDESAMTGESMPVQKDHAAQLDQHAPLAERTTMVFMGTSVSRGRGRGIVTNTGIYTELGKNAALLASVEEEDTPLEQDLERFGQRVVIGCIAVSAIVFAAGLMMGNQSARELFLVAVALAVAAIPEGLPAITTIVLALGTQRMARRNALVRRLPAVETLGCAQVICTDKTGTLTQNAMTVRRVWVDGHGFKVDGHPRKLDGGVTPLDGDGEQREIDLRLALECAAWAAGAHLTVAADDTVQIQGDPTDAALQMLARRVGVQAPGKPLAEQPFTSQRRMASVMAHVDGRARVYVRGAPEALLERAQRIWRGGHAVAISDADKQAIAAEAAAWAGQSMRVIGLAMREGLSHPVGPCTPSPEWEQELTFVGLVGIVDPPRPEVKAAIAEARRAGIRTVMITGDHPATARAIAQEIGLWAGPTDILLTGMELDHLDQQALEERIDKVAVVARATAEHKLRIVQALKARGFICAMTGDGVNDAPAVKAASIGVAMGKAGTDVTKEAAALVLSDDNYATIVAAVEEGRAIYANIRKFIFFLLSSNAGCVLFVLIASLLGWEAPLAPIQILWINLITNGLPALALGVDTRDPEQMVQPPREPGGAILSGREYLSIIVVGAVMALTALIAFHFALPDPHHASSTFALARARAIVFSILAVGPLMHSFNCRSERRSLFALGVFTNRWLWGAVAVGILLQAVTLYVPPLRPIFKTAPLDGIALAWVLAMSLVPFVLGELVKLLGLTPKAPEPATRTV